MKYADLMALPEEEREAAYAATLHEKNTEAQSLRERLKKTSPKALAIYEAMKAKFGVEDVNEEFLDMLQKQSTESMTLEQQMAQLKKNLEAEKANNAKLNEKLTATERSQRERDRDNQIVSALGVAKIRSDAMDDARKLIASDSEYDTETNSWKFGGKDLTAYVADFAKAKPYLVGNPVKGGNGDSSSSSGSGNGADFISEEEYLKMSRDEQLKPETRKRVHASMDRWG